MSKRLLNFWLLICAAILLVPSAFAANQADGAEILITQADFSNQRRSFQLSLSGPELQGSVFVAVYDGPSGQMKRVESYEAKRTQPVALDGVLETDRVKVMWTDGQYMPLAAPEEVGAPSPDATTYDKYEDYENAVLNMLQEYGDKFSASAIDAAGTSGDEYALARLLIRSEQPLPDLSEFHVAARASDSEGHAILQFTSPEDAKACADRLREYLSLDASESSENLKNYVEPDSIVRTLEATDGLEGVEMNADEIEASSYSWGVSAIHADAFAESLRKKGLPSKEFVVAVVDTGVDYNHTFLKNRMASDKGYDYIANDKDPMDEHYHGTHVAGTIVDCTPGLDNLKIMPVRVLDAGGSGSDSGVSFGIRYAADHGANIINMSLGGGHSSLMDEAVNYAVSKGVIVVVAAGNESGDAKNYCPSHIPNCITVSAVDSRFKPASFTNYGEAVDVAAPGVDIKSCVSNQRYPGNQFKSLNGTSMASPHVAACAAMLRVENPSITSAEAEKKLSGAVYVPSGWDKTYGPGVADMQPLMNQEPSEFYAILYSDGEMVFQKSATPASGRATLHAPYSIRAVSAQYAGWYALREQIKTVTFAEEVRPYSTALWFYGCENLKTISKPENLKTDGVTNMSQMFSRCGALQTLDLRGFDTKNATNMRQMFFRCGALRTILVSDAFSVSKVTDSADMFAGCKVLRGQNGTAYSDGHIDKAYARIDGGAYSPGYFSANEIDGPSEALYAALYDDGELKFQSSAAPESGRAVVKTYATNSGGYASDGDEYAAWYEERAQIRSVNFGAAIYPTSTAQWFYSCENLSSFSNIGNLHTDYVTNMAQMFEYCSGLSSLDVSGFNTASVTNMSEMFYRCSGLTSLDLSGFDTRNVTDMTDMFYGCDKLKTIYASNLFQTSQVTRSDNMFGECVAIQGGAGTSYSGDHTDKTYARIDSASAAGYFTAK